MDSAEIQLIQADRVALEQRVALMNAAYADYFIPIRVSLEQMALMDRVFDVDGSLSVVARAKWECIGMALLGVRAARAWITGVGVVPRWRRRGVARSLMHWVIDAARRAGAREVVLEVFQQNHGARRLYTDLGFQEGRELLTWQRPASADALPVPMEHLQRGACDEFLANFVPWHRSAPSWQRDIRTLQSMSDRLIAYGLDWNDELAGYCLVALADDNVAIWDVALNPASGLLLPGRLLLQALAALHWGRSLSIINVPDDDPLCRLLAALGFRVTVRQLEMSLVLS